MTVIVFLVYISKVGKAIIYEFPEKLFFTGKTVKQQ